MTNLERIRQLNARKGPRCPSGPRGAQGVDGIPEGEQTLANVPLILPKKDKLPKHPYRKYHPEVVKGRLPHGSQFKVVFDAERVLWKGSLEVPCETPDVGQGPVGMKYKLFEDTASALFWLLGKLDEQFRVWRAAVDAEKGEE